MRALARLILTLVLLPSLAWSQTDSSNSTSAPTSGSNAASATTTGEPRRESLKINQGDWEIGGEANYFKSNTGDYHELTLSPKLEYFFLNRFSAGGRLLFYDTSNVSSSIALGPSLTWYITHAELTAIYVDQSVLWVNPSGSQDNYFRGETGFGVDYFLSPSVAIGPSLRGVYYFSGDMQKPEGGLNFRIALSIFI